MIISIGEVLRCRLEVPGHSQSMQVMITISSQTQKNQFKMKHDQVTAEEIQNKVPMIITFLIEDCGHMKHLDVKQAKYI